MSSRQSVGFSDRVEDFVWYAMEFCSHRCLFSLVSKLGEQLLENNPKRCWSIVLSIAKGVFYLHSKSVVHRDLKLENVLITSTTKDGITTEQVLILDWN